MGERERYNENAACKKFKTSHAVGESTVKQKYLEGTTQLGNRVGRGDKLASKEVR